MVTICIWCIIYLLDHREQLHERDSVISLIIISIIGLLFIPIIGLTGFHIVLVSRGRTTNEQVTGKFQGGFNPFSRGCFSNCCYILCGPKYPNYKSHKRKSNHDHFSQYDSLNTGAKSDNNIKIYLDDDKALLNSPKPASGDFNNLIHKKSFTRKSGTSAVSFLSFIKKMLKRLKVSFTQYRNYRSDGPTFALERIESTAQSQSRDCEPSPPMSNPGRSIRHELGESHFYVTMGVI